MRLILYLRVSDRKQVDKYGLEAQQADVLRWAKQNGHEIVDWYVDVISGASYADDRPDLYGAIHALIEQRADGIVAGKRDRFGRGGNWIGVLQYLIKRSWESAGYGGAVPRLYSADGIGNGEEDDMIDTVQRSAMDMYSAIERIMIRNRLHGGKRVAQDKFGHHHGGAPPYGYKQSFQPGVLEINDEERPVVLRIFELRGHGLGVLDIARQLNREGFKTRKGGRWGHTSVTKVLKRADFYRGKELITGQVPTGPVAHPALLGGEGERQ